jgi:large subunit ribosomal protein L23
MKDPRDIIVAPVVSEKSYSLIEANVYTFVVDKRASKPEIHDASPSAAVVRPSSAAGRTPSGPS